MTTPRRSTSGLTLVEVAITSTILALIALALLGATLPLSDASASQGVAFDMDREAGKFMAQVRRELTQSGFQPDGTARLRVLTTTTPGDTLEFYVRQGPDSSAAPWRPVGALWVDPIRYSTAPGAVRNKIRRTEGGLTVDLIEGVESVQYTLPASGASLQVTLTLARRGTRATAAGVPADVVRTYTDQIELMNRRQ